jgi:hypothetical protein
MLWIRLKADNETPKPGTGFADLQKLLQRYGQGVKYY